jgi:hypothetical protein
VTGRTTERIPSRFDWVTKLCPRIAVLVFMGSSLLVAAQEDNSTWIAPAEAKKVQNPVKPTPDGLASAARTLMTGRRINFHLQGFRLMSVHTLSITRAKIG